MSAFAHLIAAFDEGEVIRVKADVASSEVNNMAIFFIAIPIR